MRTENAGSAYLGLPDRPEPHPGPAVIHEALVLAAIR